jgi:methyltransferase (TIGR00027 family)
MDQDRMSRTAEIVAAIRAAHFAFDDSPKIFEDPLAGDMITSPVWRLVGSNRMVSWVTRQILFRYARPIMAQVLGRARWAEDKLRKALAAGIGQYVILGAGLDSFAFRLPDWAAGIKVYEVDHPATQTAKRQRLEKLGLASPEHLEYVPIDFERETIADALARSSFSPDQTAFLSWMGTLHYLKPEAVFVTLRSLAAFARPGSEVVLDYSIPKELFAPEDSRVHERGQKDVTVRGEPWISSFDPARFPEEVCGLGFELLENLSPARQEERYFRGRKDYPRTVSGTYFAHFRLVNKAVNPGDKAPD